MLDDRVPEGFGDSPFIAFGGGALGYTNGNTRDYSAFFSTAAGQAYSVDTNGLDITWDAALTSSAARFQNMERELSRSPGKVLSAALPASMAVI
jgi:hypothetical protein